jgi:hypothetical protein
VRYHHGQAYGLLGDIGNLEKILPIG